MKHIAHCHASERRLDALIEACLRDPRPGFRRPLPLAELSVATARIATLQAVCDDRASAHGEGVACWLQAVDAGMKFRLPADRVGPFKTAILLCSGDLPAAVFSPTTIACALRSLDQLSAKGVDAIVRPEAGRLTSELWALKMLVADAAQLAEEEAARPPPLTADERAEVVRTFRAKYGSSTSNERSRLPARRDALVPDWQLLKNCEKMIADGIEPWASIARMRAAGLRSKLAGAAVSADPQGGCAIKEELREPSS